jgi:hypothetical protein
MHQFAKNNQQLQVGKHVKNANQSNIQKNIQKNPGCNSDPILIAALETHVEEYHDRPHPLPAG